MKVGDKYEGVNCGYCIITNIKDSIIYYRYYGAEGEEIDSKLKESDFFIYYKKNNEEQLTDQHYNNTNGSLYKFAQDHELNAWEFDIIKRITRCRKKGQFKEDLEKTKRVIDLYLKEFEA